MFNLSGSELVFILLLALVVLGPEKLPDAMRRFGKTVAELRRMGSSFQDEFRSTMDEPMRELRDTADLLRRNADFSTAAPDRTEKPKSPSAMSVDIEPDSVARPEGRTEPGDEEPQGEPEPDEPDIDDLDDDDLDDDLADDFGHVPQRRHAGDGDIDGDGAVDAFGAVPAFRLERDGGDTDDTDDRDDRDVERSA